MENNNTLLMRVLKIHYRDRLQILDEALKVIKEYSNKTMSTQSEYEITVLTLQSMLSDLPADILKYFLALVPLPKNTDNLIKNKDDTSNIRQILLKYLNKEIPPLVPISKQDPKVVRTTHPSSKEVKQAAPVAKEAAFKNTVNALKRPITRTRRRGTNRGPTECKKLVDVCAEYVVQNRNSLNQDYQQFKERVWRLVNSNQFEGVTLGQLYAVIRDLNKKIKWMRQLDAVDISEEIIREEYGKSNVFVKERHLEEVLKEDPFIVKEELRKAVFNFVHK